jgi:hypothetical protein
MELRSDMERGSRQGRGTKGGQRPASFAPGAEG